MSMAPDGPHPADPARGDYYSSPHPARRRPPDAAAGAARSSRAAPRASAAASARPSASPCSQPSSRAEARMPPRSWRPSTATGDHRRDGDDDPNQGTSPTVVQGNATAPDWAAVAAAVSPSVVSIDVTTAAGLRRRLGRHLRHSGHVLTNNHVVGDATGNGAITVTLADGRTYGATIVGTDPSTDLAVIKLTNGPERPDADQPRRLAGPQGRRPGHGRRQPARPLGHRDHRHRVGPQPSGQHGHASAVRPSVSGRRPATGRDQRHPDLGRDQPRQLRRRARQRQGRAHRHQQLDRLAGASRAAARAATSASASRSRSRRPSPSPTS